jgi:hypothetical protein
VVLPEFIRPTALRAMVDEARAALPGCFVSSETHNVFLEAPEAASKRGVPEGSVPLRQVRTTVGSIAQDLLPSTSPLRVLHRDACFCNFLSRIIYGNAGKLFPLDDTLGGASINVFRPGWEHGWHFDESPFSTTIMLQCPSGGGGDFEYLPNARDGDDGGESAISNVLDAWEAGNDASNAGARRLDLAPGTLSIFSGSDALHRVTPVTPASSDAAGDERFSAVLCYAKSPGERNSAAVRTRFWGRP